ncbi:DUF1043 family protein [Accumulibacter sp.]|uniref:ZapG family protein n=1 Tax=Accumulibacter sp. TaxID=2053492 RepID=UPI0025F0C491|nr:DUF1043 family protein [Accumulibacter sp.]
MTEQQLWMIFVTAVVTAAVVGFVFGRISGGGKARVASLEAEVSRQKEELAGYKRDVESHFDRTATLVASMAGSYKDLFEHLSAGYEQLSSGSARQLFRDRVVALLVGGPSAASTADKVSAALAAAGAPLEPAAAAADSQHVEASADQPATATDEEAPAATSGDAATTTETVPGDKEPAGPAGKGQAESVEKASGEQKTH